MSEGLTDNEVAEIKGYKQPGPRKGKGILTADERQTFIDGALSNAIQFCDSELSPDREQATDYYHARPFGNEEQGRSQVVMSEVRDAIHGVLPSMLRVIHGPELPVEFTPTNPKNIEQARQQSDYINYVYNVKNPGFKITQSVMKDGLIRRLGIYKWLWDESEATKPFALYNRTHEDLVTLAMDEKVNVTAITEAGETEGPPDEQGNPTKVPIFHVQGTRSYESGCARVYAVPPEEFIFTRDTRAIGDGVLIGQRCLKTRGELLAMGVDEKILEEIGSSDAGSLKDHPEAIAREPNQVSLEEPETGDANDLILYIEFFMWLDEDGDGISELRRIQTVGESYKVVEDELADEINFSCWTPILEPHTMVGQSEADLVMDLQRVNSMVMRSTLDSLAAALYPRTWYREGDANLRDVMNTEIGAPIRTKSGVNALGVFSHPFVGKESLPILAYLDDKRERRTGVRSGEGGLDMDALQSTTKSGVDAAISNSLMQVELLVRNFVEDAFKPMFRGLNRLIVQHNPRAEIVRLRGHFVEVNPASWDADMDVTVNVALGSGLTERKVATLAAIIARMETYMQLLGPVNPLVSMSQLSKALNRICELEGFAPGEYFNFVDPNWQPPQQQKEPSPEQILAQAQMQIEQGKIEKELAIKDATLKLDRERFQAEHERHMLDLQQKAREAEMLDDRERDKHAAEIRVKLEEIAATTGTQINIAAIEADIERERMTTQADLDTRKMHLDAEVKQDDSVRSAEVAKHKTETDASTKAQDRKAKSADAVAAAESAPAKEPAAKAPVIHVHVGGKKKTVSKNAKGGFDIEESD
jgi:hypothetical protein